MSLQLLVLYVSMILHLNMFLSKVPDISNALVSSLDIDSYLKLRKCEFLNSTCNIVNLQKLIRFIMVLI